MRNKRLATGSEGIPRSHQRWLVGVGILAVLIPMVLCSTALSVPAQQHPAQPKLVFSLVIDGFRADSLTRFAHLYGEGGFRRLVAEGAYFTNAQYGHLTTYTAVGHSMISTGSYASQNRMVGNDWHDHVHQTRMYCCEDVGVAILGEPTGENTGTSPRNLAGTTISDEFLMSNNRQSKSVAVSVKDRGAILMAGKLGKAYWWSKATGRFVTSSHYMESYPAWVQQFNDARPADSYFGQRWKRLLPEADYAISAPDDRPYEIDLKGNGRVFPHTITGGLDAPGADFYDAFRWTPFADEATVEFAKVALKNEQLGQRGVVDFLSISLSANDYVSHLFGPESQEAQDMALRLDRMIEGFLDFLDSEIGLSEVLVVFTADHGFLPTPEWSLELGMDAGRIDPAAMIESLNQALCSEFGQAEWVSTWWPPTIYLNEEALKGYRIPASEMEAAAQAFLRSYPGIADCFTRTQILKGAMPDTRLAQRVQHAFNHARSGHLVVIQKPFWYLAGIEDPSKYAAMHGSPYTYDTQVPVVFMGNAFAPGRYANSIDVADIAPTLANVLQVTNPSLSEGRVLHEALR